MTSGVKIAISQVKDGTMKDGASSAKIDENRRVFLEKNSLSLQKSVLVRLDYDSEDFCRYDVVDEVAPGEGMVRDGRIADGLATQTKALTLFLPLADCIGAVLYDPEHKALMLTHLGRHNLEQNGGQRSVEFMAEKFNTNPANLQISLSPSASAENYPLFTFENRGMQEVVVRQFVAAGVQPSNIAQSSTDTTTDTNYFSHSEFLKGNREIDGRFAVVAWLD